LLPKSNQNSMVGGDPDGLFVSLIAPCPADIVCLLAERLSPAMRD